MPILEPILQNARINKALSKMSFGGVIIDIGCNDPPKLLNTVSYKMEYCIGIDEVVSYSKKGNIEIFHQKIKKEIKIKSNTADVITMLAVLEHLRHPKDILKECYRVLKKNGTLIITVPAPKSEIILGLLSRLRLIKSEMIDQHENYFTKEDLKALLTNAGFDEFEVNTFELGFNILVKATK